MAKMLLVGATGLVGSAVLHAATRDNGASLTALSRRPLSAAPAHVTAIVAPIADWPAAVRTAAPDILIATLGSTIRSAGSQAAFRAVDHDLLLSVAAAAHGAGARRLILVSSVGASAVSRNFYLRTKGEVDDAVAALGFARLDILRPGLLLGERQGPPRRAERAAMLLSPLTNLLTPARFDQYRAIAAETVAHAIITLISEGGSGAHVHHNRAMRALAVRYSE